MEHLLIYIAKVSVSAILFYLFIRILMERETQHEYIRGLWLGAMAASLVMPFIYFPVPDLFPERTEAAGSVNMVVSAGEMEIIGAEEAAERTVDWARLAGWLYLAGAAAALAGYAVSNIRLASRIRRIPVTHEYDGLLSACAEASGCRRKVRLRVTDDSSVNPYSWMHDIIVSRRDIETDGRDILLHEMGHIRHAHSLDVIFTELFTVILWFNPVSWLMQYSLRQIHEYSADCTVLRSGADAREYQRLLIRKAAGTAFHSIANSFNHSNLKNRITMMLQNQTSKGAYAKSLSLLPVLACLLFVFSASRPAPEDKVSENFPDSQQSPAVEMPGQSPVSADLPEAAPQDRNDEDPVPFQFVEEKPGFMGGDANDFSKWVCEHLVYPEEAKKAGISGRVTLKFTVGKDGSVSDVKVLRGVNKLLDEEAVRVVSMSPAWTPGKIDGKPVNVSYAFPVIFMTKGSGETTGQSDDDVPDIYIDGKLASSGDIAAANGIVDGYIEKDGTIKLMSKLLSDKKDFLKWANTELVYPAAAKDAGKYGKVTVTFKLESDGSVSDISVKESPDDVLSSEVLRVTGKSPKWYKSVYQHIMVDGPGYVEYSVGFMLKTQDASGKIVTLGSDNDADIVVIAYN